MPVPQGEISSSQIWVSTDGVNEGKKNYKVQLIMKRRVVVQVKAENEEDACIIAQDVYAAGDNRLYDEFLLGPDAEVEEIKE